MASLISKITGNFTAATTWFLVNATALLDSEAGSTASTVAYVYSSSFVPTAITVDGIAVKLAARVASPTGTISIALYNLTTTTIIKEVVINVSDLPTCDTTQKQGGWIFFKFDAPVTLSATDSYQVGFKTSVAGEATLWRDATLGNWSRMLRTTTEQAPAVNDQLDIIGEHTGAGTGNDFVVTMDNTATTIFGSGTDIATAMVIGKRGTLNYAYAAATAYYLKCGGSVIVYNGGVFTIGTVANPIPRNSTAVLEFVPVADGGMGLIIRNGSTFTAQGLSRTVGKNIVSCKLNTDEAAGQTVLGVNADTGWLANDEIGIASTTRTYSQCEKRTLSAISATELTVSASLTNAHSGTSPTQAEVILLTRNVKIRAATSALVSFVSIKPTATVDIDWAEFYWLGEDVAGKRGIEIETTTGSCNIQYSSLHDFEDRGVYIVGSATNNITFSNNITYNLASLVVNCVYIEATSGTAITFDNNIIMLAVTAGNIGIYIGDNGTVYSYNTVCGINGYGFRFAENFSIFTTFSYNTAHSNAGYGMGGISTSNTYYFNGINLISWRNGSYGFYFATIYEGYFTNCVFFGNTNYNFAVDSGSLIINNIDLDGDSTFSTPLGMSFLKSGKMYILNSNFSVVEGIKTAHTSTDLIGGSGSMDRFFSEIILINTILGAVNEVLYSNSLAPLGFIKSQKHDQTAGLHKSWFRYGIIQTDSVIFRTATPSARLTPNNATNKLESGSFKVNVNSGQTCTPSVYVRESLVGDGTDYNGARIRLILKRNDAIGITADVVIATATVGSEGAFELLTGTTAAASDIGVMEFVIDCDGTTGWANIDDFSAVVT